MADTHARVSVLFSWCMKSHSSAETGLAGNVVPHGMEKFPYGMSCLEKIHEEDAFRMTGRRPPLSVMASSLKVHQD